MLRIIIPVILLVGAAVGFLFWSQRSHGPFFVSGIIEVDEIRVGSRVGGRVHEVRAKEGQRMQAGEPLIVLEPFDLREQLAQAQSTLAARRAELQRRRAGFRSEEIAQSRARRDRFKATLEKFVAGKRPLEIQMLEDVLHVSEAVLLEAQSEHARVKEIFGEGRATQREMEQAQRALTAASARNQQARDELNLAREGTRAEEIAEAQAALAEADAQLAMMESGYRREDIAEAEANVQAADAAVATIQRHLDELTVKAPGDTVVEVNDLQPGDVVAPNAPIITLVDLHTLWVRAYLPENRLNVTIGQKVAIGVDSLPGRRFAGHIVFVARQGEFTPSNIQTPEERSKQVSRIKVALDEGYDTLRAGMAADVYFEPAP